MAGDKLTLDLFFPEGGIDRTAPYLAQPPHTTVDSLNVLPIDVAKGRLRGGSRMGLDKYDSANIFGAGNPVRMVAPMVKSDGTKRLTLTDNGLFYYETSSGVWSTGSLGVLSTTGRMCWTVMGDKIFIADSDATSPYFYNATNNNNGAHGNPALDPLGNVPQSCNVVANVGNRLVFAGDPTAQRAYYMSRVGNPNDYQYADTDEGRAVSGSLAVGGANNDAIKAIIPWYADYSLWCCESSMSLLIGDNPNTGAYFYSVSARLGCLDAMSWCRGPQQTLFVMTRDGLAMCDPGSPRAEPKLVSVEKIPRELLAIDSTAYDVSLIWDSRAQGVHIFITKRSATSGLDHWYWSQRGGGFWRMQYPTNCEPFSVCAYPSVTSTGTNILLGCRDGRLRNFSLTTKTDDGTSFSSHVYLGPFRPSGNNMQDGKILELVGVLSQDSGTVDYDILGAATPEQAYTASSLWNNSLSAGRSYTHRPRVRCGDAYIKVSGPALDDWSLERISITSMPGGRQR